MSHELRLLLLLFFPVFFCIRLSTSEPTRRIKQRSGFIISQVFFPPPSRNKMQPYITQISPIWQQPPPPLPFPLPCIFSIWFSIFFGREANCLLIPRSLKQLNTVFFPPPNVYQSPELRHHQLVSVAAFGRFRTISNIPKIFTNCSVTSFYGKSGHVKPDVS